MFWAVLLTLAAAGSGALPLPAEAPQAAERVVRTYTAFDEEFPNPERGLVLFANLVKERDLAWLREKGVTLGYSGISLAAYRTTAIDPAFLAKLEEGFGRARAAGLKIILRFTYSSDLGDADAPKAWVLKHVDQLKPLLQANADVIAVVQAGFIGAWGEWHGSTNGLDDPASRKEVLGALLAAVPASRAVQLRAPRFKLKLLGAPPVGEAEAYKGSPRARVGHHNDAFFSDATDMGTYDEPVKGAKEWLAQESRFVPVGGETTAGPPRGTAGEFCAELEKFHWSFLHWRYPDEVKKQWEQQGHLTTLRKRLGYRFSLVEASWPAAVRPGGELRLTVRLRNSGFAAPFNRRPVAVVLSNERLRRVAAVSSVDPRRWAPGEESKFTLRLAIPGGMGPGTYRLSLAMPDESARLASRPEYAIRFANEKVWDAAAGENVLGEVRVDAAVPGTGDFGAKEFSEIP
jgi:uncharacterized protein DUF4832/uncharacterized protein DUF4874